jgi:hypothetical protein
LPFLAVQLGGRTKCENDVAAWWYHEDKVDANACVTQDCPGSLCELIKQQRSSFTVGCLVSYVAMFIHRCHPMKSLKSIYRWEGGNQAGSVNSTSVAQSCAPRIALISAAAAVVIGTGAF